MSPVRTERIDGLSRTCIRLLSKHYTSNAATVGRTSKRLTGDTNQAGQFPATEEETPTRGTGGGIRDRSSTLSDRTTVQGSHEGGDQGCTAGGASKDKIRRRGQSIGKEDANPCETENISEMLRPDVTTKGISFHPREKTSPYRAGKTAKAKNGKLVQIPCKRKVTHPAGRMCLLVSNEGKSKRTKEDFQYLRVYKSSLRTQSDSSKLSDSSRSFAHKSRSDVGPPHQSKKRLSVISQAGNLKPPSDKTNIQLAVKRRAIFPQSAPSKLVKTQSSQNCYFVSFNVSPRKVFCRSGEMLSQNIPRIEDAVRLGVPHRCMGHENLVETDSKIRSDGRYKKRNKIKSGGSYNSQSKIKSDCCYNKQSKIKNDGCYNKQSNIKSDGCYNKQSKIKNDGCYNKQSKIKSDGCSKRRQESSKRRTKNRGTAKVPGSQEISRHQKVIKSCQDKHGKTVSQDESGTEGNSYTTESQLPSSKLSVRSVLCETHPIQNIFEKSALVFLRADKERTRLSNTKPVKEKPKIALFSRNIIESNRQLSDFEHFIYRQKLPPSNYYSTLLDTNSAFVPGISQATVDRKQDEQKQVSSPLTEGFSHCVTLGNEVVPLNKDSEEHYVKVKFIKQKSVSGTTGQTAHRTAIQKDTLKPTAGNETRKGRHEDVSSAAVSVNKMLQRPQTTICHFPGVAESPHGDQFPGMKLSNCDSSKDGSGLNHSPLSFSSVQNVFDHKSCWDYCKTTHESLSSFLKEISHDGATRREQIALLRGTFQIPTGSITCEQRKLDIFHKQLVRDTEDIKMCFPHKPLYRPSISQSHSSCCSLSFIPPLFSFLQCFDKTISAPVFARTSHDKALIHRADRSAVDATGRLPLTNDESFCGDKVSTSLKDNKQHLECTTDGKETGFDEEVVTVVEDMLAGNILASGRISDFKKSRKIENQGGDLNHFQRSDHDNEAQIHSRICCTQLSVAPPNAARSILRTGRIFSSKDSQQSGKIRGSNLPSKHDLLQERFSNYPPEQTWVHPAVPFPEGRRQKFCRVMMLALVIFLTFIQFVLYYIISRK